MGRDLEDIINGLPQERRAKIAARSQEMVEEMLAHAVTLADFRKAVGKTQSEVAKELGINQNAISQLEGRSEIYFSTLRRFLKSLGMTLELSVISENGSRIDLPNFLSLPDSDDPVNANSQDM
jgi:transcriptional regulator with XRE-family HTH domain